MRYYRLNDRLPRACAVLASGLMGFAAACTSSSTGAGTSTNQNFDTNYRQPTTSTQQYDANNPDPTKPEPVYTVMEIGTETGEIYPGEDYPVFAVVDKPQDTEIEYHWSSTNGALAELPEADRGRIQTLIEQEDTAIRTSGAAKTEGPATGETAPGAEGAVPPAGADAGAPPTGVVPPGGTPSSATGPVAPGPVSTGGAAPTKVWTVNDLEGDQANYPDAIKQFLVRQRNGEQLTPEELKQLQDYMGGEAKAGRTSSLFERRFVGAPSRLQRTGPVAQEETPEDVGTDEPVEVDVTPETEDDAAQLAEDALDAAHRELDDFRDSGTVADNVAEGGATGRDLDTGAVGARPRNSSIRDEYETWSTSSGEVRRRNLGGVDEEEADDEELTAEDAYKASTFVTDVPYVLWSPSRPGDATLYCKVVMKDEDQTDPKPLHVDVTLRDAKVEIADDFPDIIREDDDVLIRLDAENIPDFQKGLFTVTFDPDVLSFRSAELGEFFDDAAASSIYYAEPDKTAGKVLLAVDSNTEVAELSGDGPVVYAKFKAKQDIEDQADTKLAMELDNSARYVLDRNGDNILPIPVERQPLRSEVTVPPLQTDVPRDVPEQTAPAAGTQTSSPGQTSTLGGTSSAPLSSGGSIPQSGGATQTGGNPVIPGGDATMKPQAGVKPTSSAGSASGAEEVGPKPVAPISAGPAAPGEMVGPVKPGTETEEDEKKLQGSSN